MLGVRSHASNASSPHSSADSNSPQHWHFSHPFHRAASLQTLQHRRDCVLWLSQVTSESSSEDVKRAYYKKALQLHPDKVP